MCPKSPMRERRARFRAEPQPASWRTRRVRNFPARSSCVEEKRRVAGRRLPSTQRDLIHSAPPLGFLPFSHACLYTCTFARARARARGCVGRSVSDTRKKRERNSRQRGGGRGRERERRGRERERQAGRGERKGARARTRVYACSLCLCVRCQYYTTNTLK